MIDKDPNGKTVREQRGSSIFPCWVYHFESGGYRSPDWDETTYQSILKTQESTPVVVGKKDRRVWWLFRRNFYCEEEGHNADEVKAFATSISKNEKPCPYCGEAILLSATRCKHCAGELRYCPRCKATVAIRTQNKFVGIFRGVTQSVGYCVNCGTRLFGPSW